MAIEGSLNDLSVPTLVQSLIHEGLQAQIQFEQAEQVGWLYVDMGNIWYAAITNRNGSTILAAGEEVVYELLSWKDGRFTIIRNKTPPTRNVQHSWDYLLMEGLRQWDEKREKDFGSENGSDLSILEIEQEIANIMASKSEQIQMILNDVVSSSSDISGAVVVSNDGLLMASALTGTVDSNRVAAVSAGLVSLANRSVQQLSQGELQQTLIQASGGNIIAVRAGGKATFVALLPMHVNLGMAFLECRDAANSVKDVL